MRNIEEYATTMITREGIEAESVLRQPGDNLCLREVSAPI